jgi:hypothetical protein
MRQRNDRGTVDGQEADALQTATTPPATHSSAQSQSHGHRVFDDDEVTAIVKSGRTVPPTIVRDFAITPLRPRDEHTPSTRRIIHNRRFGPYIEEHCGVVLVGLCVTGAIIAAVVIGVGKTRIGNEYN